MTAPENPPRLWACTHCAGEYISVAARLDLVEDCDEDGCVASPVAEYVLASTAAAEREAAVKAAREKFADLIEKADDLADDLVGRPRSSEVTEALRRERDALQAWKDRAIDELRRCEVWFRRERDRCRTFAGDLSAMMTTRDLWESAAQAHEQAICKVDSMRGALCCKDEAAAAKGVG